MQYIPAAHTTVGTNLPVDVIVIHGTVSRCYVGSALATANYFANPASGGSAHYAVDPGTIIQCVKDNQIAWHAPPNSHKIGIELTDPVLWKDGTGRNAGFYDNRMTSEAIFNGRWSWPDYDAMLRLGATLTRDLCSLHKVPLVRLTVADLLAGKRGICGHIDISNAFKRTTHTDPGPTFPWDKFMAYVRGDTVTPPPIQEDEVVDVFQTDPDGSWTPVQKIFVKDGRLGVFAPGGTGTPPPVVVVPPPVDVPPPVVVPPPVTGDTTVRKVFADRLHLGVTDSDSVRAVQEALNKVSFPPNKNIAVNGNYDQTTFDMVKAFQTFIGDAADGLLGPKQTKALFDRAGMNLEWHSEASGGGGGVSTPPPVVSTNITTIIPGGHVTTPYGVKGSWAAGYHTGDDWACPNGTHVRTTWTGRVVAINAWGAAYGIHVIQEFSTGGQVRRQAFCHLQRAEVSVGQTLRPGDWVGYADSTGNVTGPHCHLEQRVAPFTYGAASRKPVY